MNSSKKPRKRGNLIILSTFIALVIVGLIFARPVLGMPDPSVLQSSPGIADTATSITLETQSPTSAPTSNPSPTSTEKALSYSVQDTIILSMLYENFYQLFSFDPEAAKFSRLTDNSYDIITPAVSPDGNFLAFSSNWHGYWDLYILEFSTNSITKITDTPQYDAAPTWSPDGKWIAFETYLDDNLEIQILSLTQDVSSSVRLTDDPALDQSPVWSPEGRYLLFVSNRSGDDEIWLADLQSTQDLLTNISKRPAAVDRDPEWSPDGRSILWSSIETGIASIMRQNRETGIVDSLAAGTHPRFNSNGSAMMVISHSPVDAQISIHFSENNKITNFAPQRMGMVSGSTWVPAVFAGSAIQSLRKMTGNVEDLTPQTIDSSYENQPGNKLTLGTLDGVNAPHPYLVSNVVDDFAILRGLVNQSIGWNFMDNLENAFIPVTQPPSPEMEYSWLFTGRAIAINTSPLYGGWMCVVREDYNGQTYWRVFIKTRFQDGSQGQPIKSEVWDFTTRYSGETKGYEEGGSLSAAPKGYWIDFTALAAQFGWQRTPALQDWRTYMDGTLLNQYIHEDDMTWTAAMLQLYPPEALVTATRVPTMTPVP